MAMTITVSCKWIKEEPDIVEPCGSCEDDIFRMGYFLRIIGGKGHIMALCESCGDVIVNSD